jgi:hypothetical protein
MANATISVTDCDNELFLVAVNSVSNGPPNQSYLLAHIESGNSNSVAVTVTVSAADNQYVQPQTLIGVALNTPINSSYTVYLPAGTYSLVAVGINWGGYQQFTVSLNNALAVSLPLTNPNLNPDIPTVVWTPSSDSTPPTGFSTFAIS